MDEAARCFLAAADAFDSHPDWKLGLLLDAARLLSKQGQNGSGYSEKRGSFCFGPNLTATDEEEEAWKKSKLLQVLSVCEKALALKPSDEEDVVELQRLVADALRRLERVSELVAFFRRLLERDPQSRSSCLGLCRALVDKNDDESLNEAKDVLARFLEANPSSGSGWTLYLEALKKCKADQQIQDEASSKAKFFSFIPDRMVEAFPVNYAPNLAALLMQVEGEGDAMAAVTDLRQNPSNDALVLLAAIGAHHYHGPIDDSVFEGLFSRRENPLVADLCFFLIRLPGVSLCTIRLAFRCLCGAKDPRAFDLGKILLPQDVQMFPMDIAKSLALLAPDERVVELLIAQAQGG